MEYSKLIKKSSNMEELEKVKEIFLEECRKQEKKISVIEEIRGIKSFGDLENIFESICPQLFSTPEGRKLIRNYTSVIKENEDLKKEYTLIKGISENRGKLDGSLILKESLEILGTANKKKIDEGVKKLIPILSEGLLLIGTDDISWVGRNKDKSSVNEDIDYLITNKKGIFNLGEYSDRSDRVSTYIGLKESRNNEEHALFSIDDTLDKLVDTFQLRKDAASLKESDDFYEEIAKAPDKKSLFEQYKSSCIEQIDDIITKSTIEESSKLSDMKTKLMEKAYNFDCFTNDIIKLKDLQQTLNEIWEQR